MSERKKRTQSAEVLYFRKPSTSKPPRPGEYEVYVSCSTCAKTVRYASGACSECGTSIGETA